jgi:hypothetical protein
MLRGVNILEDNVSSCRLFLQPWIFIILTDLASSPNLPDTRQGIVSEAAESGLPCDPLYAVSSHDDAVLSETERAVLRSSSS